MVHTDLAVRAAGRARSLWRLARFGVASLAASATSSVAFGLAYGWGAAGPQLASFAAFAAGATVSFAISRFWAWDRRDSAGLGRHAAAFFGMALVVAILAAGVTTVTERYAVGAGLSGDVLMVVVGASYLATYAVMFFVKFLILDRLVFKTEN